MINDTKQSVEKELAEYKEQKANLLGPTIRMDALSEFHKIVIDTETLSINPADKDIYKHKDKYGERPAQYIITGQGLQKLALCAGVMWNPAETRATKISQRYVAYNAVGCIRKPDGTPAGYQAEADVDIDVEEDDLREKFKEKKKKWLDGDSDWFRKMGKEAQNDYIENAFRKELNFKKRHKVKTAATNARSRVIRPLLRIKPTYTLAELSKPFYMPRVVLHPDYSDPEVKKLMLAEAIQSQTGVFGPAPSQTPVIDIPSGDYEVRPAPENELEPPPHGGGGDDASVDSDAMPKDVFEALPVAEQQLELEERAKAKGYDLSGLPTPISGMDNHNRLRFFEHLATMPVLSDANDSDIPF